MVLSPDGGHLHTFIEPDERPSETGELIFSLADGSRSVNDIVDAVLAAFTGASRPQVEQDVITFVQGLVDKNVLVLNQTPTNR
jgi:hypothetical protein